MSGGTRSSDLSDDDYANLALTRRLIRRYLAFSERAAESAGLEPQHYQLLLMLRGLTPTGGADISDLSDWLQIRHHSAVGLVDRMEARALVERRADPHNGRRVLVVLTRKGRSALRSLAVLHRDELLRLAPGLVESLQQLVNSPRPEPAPLRAPMPSGANRDQDAMFTAADASSVHGSFSSIAGPSTSRPASASATVSATSARTSSSVHA